MRTCSKIVFFFLVGVSWASQAQLQSHTSYFSRMMSESDRVFDERSLQLRTAASKALKKHCGKCHYEENISSAEAKEIFDLNRGNWWYKMNTEQLRSAAFRIQSMAQASPAEKDVFQKFVDSEIRFRLSEDEKRRSY